MLTIGTTVLGVSDVRRAMDFWGAALGYVPRDEPDDTWVVLVPAEGTGARLLADPEGNRFCVVAH